jgi:hypothetical protein
VVAYDFKVSNEDLDRTGIISSTVPDDIYNYSLKNTQYIGHWVHLHYRAGPKLNLALYGMMDIANWKNYTVDLTMDPGATEHIRTAWGYIPTIEYYPWDDLNLRFFANWVGRIYDYSDYATRRLGVNDYSTGRFTIGFVSPLGVF